jgi:hypothetical protein
LSTSGATISREQIATVLITLTFNDQSQEVNKNITNKKILTSADTLSKKKKKAIQRTGTEIAMEC